MNEEKLIWAAGYIDDDLVCEAIDYKPRRIKLAPLACAAAAAVVLVTAVAVIARQIGKPPVLPPDSSGVAVSSGYTDGTENSSAPNDPQDSTSSDPERQGVDIGNGMTLVGTPIDVSELEAYPVTFDKSAWALTDAEEEFIDSLEIPELKELIKREARLTRYCLSAILVSWAPSVQPTDGGEPPYIQTANGRRYYETGYTYDSFYNEYLRTFTEETIGEMFQKYNVFLNYNGELFCSDGARGGWLGEVHREYELISKTDTVIEFRELIFYKDSDDKPAAEYVPELRGEYDLGVIDYKFVLTEDGWRAANIPVEYETELSDLKQSGDGKAYSAIFERFYPEGENPTIYGPPMTCEEVTNMLKPKPDFPEYDLDSYYLVEVIRALTNEEYMQMNGWSSYSVHGNTIYEVRLVEDLIRGSSPERTAYVRIPAGNGARVQLYGDPTYAPGEMFTAAVSKPCEGYDFVTSLCDSTLRYDLSDAEFTKDDAETMLYYRGRGQARQPIADLPFETEEINIEAAFSTPQNPATYIQKIALDDLVQFLSDEWQAAGLIDLSDMIDLSQENAHAFSAGRVYPDDELVPSEWMPVVSDAEAMDKFEKIIRSDTSATEPEGALAALMNRSVLCYDLFFGVSRDMLNIDWNSPYYHSDFENPIYPFSTEYFSDTQTIYDLAYATFERSVAEELLHGVWDLSGEPRYFEENGQMYINNSAFPAGAGGAPAFIARSYVEITEKTDNKCTFIWHYPDVEELNPPKDGYEFFYYEKTCTAEYIDGSWKLDRFITNIP